MNEWIPIITALGGLGGLGTLLALFVVPAAKRHEDSQKRLSRMERKIERLTRSDATMRSIILLLIQRDEDMAKRLREKDPSFTIEPMEAMLKRMNLSLASIVGGPGDDEDEDGEVSK